MKIMHDARHGIKNVRVLQAIHAPTSPYGDPSVLILIQKVREERIAFVHTRAYPRNVCKGKHRKSKTERRAGETHAFAIDSDPARVPELYFLFREKDPRDQRVEREHNGKKRKER